MTAKRDLIPTLPETTGTSDFERNEANSGHFRVERRETLWQARLVLSTLDPRDPLSGRLRNAIRQGNQEIVQLLLDGIFAERGRESDFPEADETNVSGPRSVITSTMLPPPSVRKSS